MKHLVIKVFCMPVYPLACCTTRALLGVPNTHLFMQVYEALTFQLLSPIKFHTNLQIVSPQRRGEQPCEGEKGKRSGGHLMQPTLGPDNMLLYNVFFPDCWKFWQLPFETNLTKNELIPELTRQMPLLTGNIRHLLVVGISRFSSDSDRRSEHLCHRYPTVLLLFHQVGYPMSQRSSKSVNKRVRSCV